VVSRPHYKPRIINAPVKTWCGPGMTVPIAGGCLWWIAKITVDEKMGSYATLKAGLDYRRTGLP